MNEDREIEEPTLKAKRGPSRACTLMGLVLLHATSVGLVWLGMNAVLPDGSNRGEYYERLQTQFIAYHIFMAVAAGLGIVLSLLAGFFVRASAFLSWGALATGYLTWSVLDASQYGGHGMLPFEWAFAIMAWAPLFLLVMIGRALGRAVDPHQA